jgi:hypothetical protein
MQNVSETVKAFLADKLTDTQGHGILTCTESADYEVAYWINDPMNEAGTVGVYAKGQVPAEDYLVLAELHLVKGCLAHSAMHRYTRTLDITGWANRLTTQADVQLVADRIALTMDHDGASLDDQSPDNSTLAEHREAHPEYIEYWH